MTDVRMHPGRNRESYQRVKALHAAVGVFDGPIAQVGKGPDAVTHRELGDSKEFLATSSRHVACVDTNSERALAQAILECGNHLGELFGRNRVGRPPRM